MSLELRSEYHACGLALSQRELFLVYKHNEDEFHQGNLEVETCQFSSRICIKRHYLCQFDEISKITNNIIKRMVMGLVTRL